MESLNRNTKGKSSFAKHDIDHTSAVCQLDAIFRAYPENFFHVGTDGKILDYRIGNLAALYLPPEKIPGSHIQEVFPLDVGGKLLEAVHQVFYTGKVAVVEYRSNISGKDRWFEGRLSVVSESGVAVIIREVTEREEALIHQQRHAQQLSALHTIEMAISASFDINIPLTIILQQTINLLGVDAADIRLLDPLTHMLDFAAGKGFRTDHLQKKGVIVGQGYAGEAALQRKTIKMSDLAETPLDQARSSFFRDEGFQGYYAVPMIAKGDVKGVLEIYQREVLDPGEDWWEFLNMLAGQAAVAIENAVLFQHFQRANSDLMMAYDAVIESWSQALELSGRETKQHTSRVVWLATKLASSAGMEESEILQLQRGAKLHDIGKICVPENILQKSGPLTDEEWAVIRQHPKLAYQLLSPIKYLASALDIPHYHHEKWDGSGYPDGLKGDQIPLVARLFSIVHVYDALITDHPYRSAWTKEKALMHIQGQSGKQFDPALVMTFLEMMISKTDLDH
jgi:HD-GYP domain-containing protein (c-di-GMP phosphodiesterase class II)